MGWSSANAIFDPVAKAMVELDAPDEMKIRVLGDLIDALQSGDWDTEDESLMEFEDDEAIVEAFRQHDVILTCDAEGTVQDVRVWCVKERGHPEGGAVHSDGSGREWA